MPQDDLSGPDLAGVIADAESVGLPHVVIGGFGVIYHGYIRATKDSDILVPDGEDADGAVLRFLERSEGRRLHDGKALELSDVGTAEHLRVSTRHGIVDILRGGPPPLDFETVAKQAEETDWEGQTIRVASLASLVGFKRIANRPRDQLDLAELEAIHGALPIEPIPGLDQ